MKITKSEFAKIRKFKQFKDLTAREIVNEFNRHLSFKHPHPGVFTTLKSLVDYLVKEEVSAHYVLIVLSWYAHDTKGGNK